MAKKITITCETCGKKRTTYKSNLVNGRGRYCSQSCAKKGKPSWNKGKTNFWMIGKKNPRWNSSPNYRAVHKYIQLKRGKAEICDVCGESGGQKGCHWATTTGEYSRRLSEYISLCALHHRQMDLERGLIQVGNN